MMFFSPKITLSKKLQVGSNTYFLKKMQNSMSEDPEANTFTNK